MPGLGASTQEPLALIRPILRARRRWCPANGAVHIEMLQTFNGGLESIVVKVGARDAVRIKGSLKTGKDPCSGPGGSFVYCKTTGDYTFDAPFVK